MDPMPSRVAQRDGTHADHARGKAHGENEGHAGGTWGGASIHEELAEGPESRMARLMAAVPRPAPEWIVREQRRVDERQEEVEQERVVASAQKAQGAVEAQPTNRAFGWSVPVPAPVGGGSAFASDLVTGRGANKKGMCVEDDEECRCKMLRRAGPRALPSAAGGGSGEEAPPEVHEQEGTVRKESGVEEGAVSARHGVRLERRGGSDLPGRQILRRPAAARAPTTRVHVGDGETPGRRFVEQAAERVAGGWNEGTLHDAVLSWHKYWMPFCAEHKLKHFRDRVPDEEEYLSLGPLYVGKHGATAEEFEGAVRVNFRDFVADKMKPRSRKDQAPKLTSINAVIRNCEIVHGLGGPPEWPSAARTGLGLPFCNDMFDEQAQRSLRNFYKKHYGPSVFKVRRKQPLPDDVVDELFADLRGRSDQRTAKTYAAAFALSLHGAFRLAEVAWPEYHGEWDRRHIRRSNFTWIIRGTRVVNPTREQLARLRVGDWLEVEPPPSKCDTTGEWWGDQHLFLPYDPSYSWNAAFHVAELLKELPAVDVAELKELPALPLGHGRPLRAKQARGWLNSTLRRLHPSLCHYWSWHSARITCATRLKKAGRADAEIQAWGRWRTLSSMRVYTRLSPETYKKWALDLAECHISRSEFMTAEMCELDPEDGRVRRTVEGRVDQVGTLVDQVQIDSESEEEEVAMEEDVEDGGGPASDGMPPTQGVAEIEVRTPTRQPNNGGRLDMAGVSRLCGKGRSEQHPHGCSQPLFHTGLCDHEIDGSMGHAARSSRYRARQLAHMTPPSTPPEPSEPSDGEGDGSDAPGTQCSEEQDTLSMCTSTEASSQDSMSWGSSPQGVCWGAVIVLSEPNNALVQAGGFVPIGRGLGAWCEEEEEEDEEVMVAGLESLRRSGCVPWNGI